MARRLTVLVMLLAAVGPGAACRREPKCEGELTSDELYRLQELDANGKYPCRGHLEPTIEVGPDGIVLNGRAVARREDLPTDRPRLIQKLRDPLKTNRETWKQIHPGRPFEAHPQISIDGGSSFATGASALVSTAYAGYPNARVSSGGVVFEMLYDVPGPPRPDEEEHQLPTEIVFRAGNGGYDVALRKGRTVIGASDGPLALDAVPGWVAQRCSALPEPCAAVLVLDLQGEFAVAATLIRSIMDGPGFRRAVPTIKLAVQ